MPGKAVPVNGGQDLTVETKEFGDTVVHMWNLRNASMVNAHSLERQAAEAHTPRRPTG
jgi:hypothetical protein